MGEKNVDKCVKSRKLIFGPQKIAAKLARKLANKISTKIINKLATKIATTKLATKSWQHKISNKKLETKN